MNYFQISGLPQIIFAHIFETGKYTNSLPLDDDCLEITFVTNGRLFVEQDGKKAVADKNDIILNLHRSVLHLESKDVHAHHTICFRVSFRVLSDYAEEALSIPLITHTGTNAAYFNNLIDEIIQTHTLHSDHNLLCSGLFLQILDKLHECNKQNTDKILYSNLVYTNKAKTYIYNHLNRPIQQIEIAEYLNISSQYLCAVFKKTEGVPLMTFINKIKLEKIRFLMEKENLKLYEAAEMLGYSNPNYVSKIYKKYFKMNITDIPKNTNQPL